MVAIYASHFFTIQPTVSDSVLHGLSLSVNTERNGHSCYSLVNDLQDKPGRFSGGILYKLDYWKISLILIITKLLVIQIVYNLIITTRVIIQ